MGPSNSGAYWEELNKFLWLRSYPETYFVVTAENGLTQDFTYFVFPRIIIGIDKMRIDHMLSTYKKETHGKLLANRNSVKKTKLIDWNDAIINIFLSH